MWKRIWGKFPVFLMSLAYTEPVLYTPETSEPVSVKVTMCQSFSQTQVQECIELILYKLETLNLQGIFG